MERSVIRDQPIPDYAALHPGYKAARKPNLMPKEMPRWQ